MIRLNHGRMSTILGRGLLTVLTAALVLTSTIVGAQTVPTGYQDYFVLGYEQHVWDMMDRVRSYELPTATFDDGMNSVVTAVASADNQVLYYDHWEDGLEADLLASPHQDSTLVLGNNDSNDGLACEYTTDPRVVCGTADEDTLFEGTFLTLNSDQGLPPGCTTIRCSVPLNPRDSDDIRFDGGDRVITSGGPLSVIHNQNPGTQVIGGATENISEQTVRTARSYSIPIGEDIYYDYGGEGGDTQPFKYVDIGLVAFEDDTAVFIDSPGETPVSLVLDRGESYSSRGLIDSSAAPAITINAGTKISTDKGVAGFIHTGGDGYYATRFYTLLPDILHATDYVITAPGDDPDEPAGADPEDRVRPANIYIFNPDPINDIEVTATDTVGTVVVDVPANSSVPYSDIAGANRDVPPGSTVRMVSDRRFWGVSAYDYTYWASDWGHSWLARRFLTGIYTVGWAPGSSDTNPSTGLNASPVFVSATQDNTYVLIDLDNDDIYDQVDLDGDGSADPPDLTGNVYIVDALEALTIFDHTDFDNTGTRIVANKPVALAWGQDTDLDSGGVIAHDTGYTVYPINQLFLDPILTIDKLADTETVPQAGGVVSYTLTVEAHGASPLDNLDVSDLLPAGVPTTAYVTGSSLITYPDLAQDTADPSVTIDSESGRTLLDWTLSQTTIQPGQYITVQYDIDFDAVTQPGLLLNTGRAHGSIGSSVFSPVAYETVVQTDAVLAKTVSHDGTPEVGETLHYTLTVENTGAAEETDVVITDPIPPDTTFSSGSITSPVGPFSGSYDPGQNAVVWTASTFAAGAGPYALEFDVVINPGVEAETALLNEASYESTETPYFVARASLVTTGPSLEYEKQGPAILHPNETATFEISVHNTGVAAADNLTILDTIPLNTTYLAGSMEFSLNSGPFSSLTDADDGDQGVFQSGRVEFNESLLGPGEDILFRFSVTVDPGTDGEFVNNQATVYSTELPPGDTNLVQIPIEGDSEIEGVIFLDLDGDGTRDPSEPGIPYVDVTITDSLGNVQVVSTDAAGEYSVFVETGNATVEVDDTDPDFPSGATLTTGNNPHVVTASSGTSTQAQDVGYEPQPLTLNKVSDATDSEVWPGQTVTYTITLTNNTSETQTGISLQDPVPAGTSYVAGSSQIAIPGSRSLRVTEYYLSPTGGFSGDTYDLTLDQALADDYFVMIRGSDGNGGSADDDRRGPDEDYVSLVTDPNGTGDLSASAAENELSFIRRNSIDNWTGVITVVECLADCSTDGFELVDVARITHTATSTGTATLPTGSWSDINQVQLMGGHNGAGCDSTETATRFHFACHIRYVPSSSNEIDWSRRGNTSGRNAVSTVMALEWGSSWTVQDVRVQGNNGGGGADQVSDYNTAALSTSVNRNNTWVWGTGFTSDNGVGDTAEGCLITLGDGVNQNASENQVAVGLEYANNAVDFQVWAMTHSDLIVDYEFEPDGNDNDLTVDRTVSATGAERMALAYNGMGSDSARDWPASIFSARYVTDDTIRMQRRFSDYTFPAWIQGADFSAFTNAASSAPAGDPPNLIDPTDGYTLPPGESLTVTFQVDVDADLDPAVTQISNTATAMTVEQPAPVSATATDDVVRAGVIVEPNNSGYGAAGSTVVYNHAITNTGDRTDSFDITPQTEQGWPVELLDPTTGAVLAQDLDADGVWDNGVTINTGTLPVGESATYDFRVTIPTGTANDTQQTAGLRATSVRSPTVTAAASDETLVVGGLSEVIITPDNSGVTTPSGSVAYSHHVINRTGAPETLNLYVQNSQSSGWTSTIHWDTNGDGEYTPGVDLEISNTRRLDDGESQLVFVVVTADNQPHGTVNVSSVIAESSSDPSLLDAATDTTTILDEPIDFDLSGGGTRQVVPGDTAVFPGHLRNLGDIDDTYEMTITASDYYNVDGLPHGTELWIDSDGNGTVDLLLAEDSQGDGIWDSVASGYGIGPNGGPIVPVSAGGTLDYELRRPVSPAQRPYRDPVTLTATSQTSGDQDSVTATNLLLTESRAVLASFDTYAIGNRVVVEWSTASEIGTVGFELYRRDGRGAGFVKVNGRLLRGVLGAPQGGVYRIVDETVSAGSEVEYVLVERDVWGEKTSFGPFSVTARELADNDDRRNAAVWRDGYEALQRESIIRRSAAVKRGERAQPADRMKIAVDKEGLVRLEAAEIGLALGMNAEKLSHYIESGAFRIMTGGEDVAWMPEIGGGALYFFGEASDSIYSRDRVYVLEVGKGLLMSVAYGELEEPKPGGFFSESMHFEEEHIPVTALVHDPEGDFWVWDLLYVGSSTPVTKSYNLVVPAPAAARKTAAISIRLLGAMTSDVGGNHLVSIRLNGRELGTAEWNDLDVFSGSFSFPSDTVVEGSNTLELTVVLAPGVDVDLVALDAVDLEYARTLEAVDERLLFKGSAGRALQVTGFSDPGIVVLDLTDRLRPVVLPGGIVKVQQGGYGVDLIPPGSEEILAVATVGAITPHWITPDQPSNLWSAGNSAVHLVIAGPGLADAAQQLADYRTANGLESRVVRIEDVYDEFNNGMESPWAIRDFLEYARKAWAVPPQYVVLAGDGSFDYLDRLGAHENLIPSPQVATDSGLFGSDHPLADFDDDGIPDMAIGRLPVHDAAELEVAIDKIITAENADKWWRYTTLWVADEADRGGEFSQDLDAIIDQLHSRFSATRIDLGITGLDMGRDLMIQRMNRGAALVGFLGHAGMDRLGDDGVLTLADVGLLDNQERLPVLTAHTCVAGRFDMPTVGTLAEALVLHPDGGVAALWSPVGLTMSTDTSAVGLNFVEVINRRPGSRVGDAVKGALWSWVVMDGGDPEVAKLFVLLGDPAFEPGW